MSGIGVAAVDTVVTATRFRHKAQGCPPTAGYPGRRVKRQLTTLKGLRLSREPNDAIR